MKYIKTYSFSEIRKILKESNERIKWQKETGLYYIIEDLNRLIDKNSATFIKE